MNILYLSHLSGEAYAGPTYSVPKQIEAQSKLDNVFWYNAVKTRVDKWKQLPFYHDRNEYPNERIKSLPEPFNNPDIIVVELFYNMVKSPLIRELLRGEIPYIIIPRGELTKQAQARKRLKKKIANFLVCKRYAQRAAAIQYLTEQEYKDSGDIWNENHSIIPNGIDLPEKTKETFSENAIKCISIGRIEPYQKGLDMLIEACSQIKSELIESNCIITICGPDKENKLAGLKQLVKNQGLDSVINFHDGVFGKEKEKMLLDSDVFLIPSRFEGHPMALIEALSLGLPCVASEGSNMKVEIDEENAGWTADNNVESICDALHSMINEIDTFFIKSQNAISLSGKYGWIKIAKKSNFVYANLVKKYRKNDKW